VADPTFIEVDDAAGGADLARCFHRHGLIAGLARIGDRWAVEVRSLGEDPRLFFADLGLALASWNGAGGSSRGRTVRRRAA
jgi:hypothetical protein